VTLKSLHLAALPATVLLASTSPVAIAGQPGTNNAEGQRCEAIAAMAFPGAKVTASASVAAGAFTLARPAMLPDFADRLRDMPAFCQVQIVATPSSQSHIGIEVWLPQKGWNGRFLGTGNGGGAGMIAYEMGMVEGLKRGFAVANTDMGTAPDINQSLNEPEHWTDFGYRATHEMTRIAKLVVSAYYKASAFRAYFAGCSTGGQQALSAAQRYPADYDGILAGDPGNNRTHVAASFVWNYAALTASPTAQLSSAQWATVSQTVIKTCAGKDGGAPGDRFLTDPRQCRFDVSHLRLCHAGETSDACFSEEQVGTLRRLYAGPINPETGERIYPGLTVGSEDQPLGPVMQGSAQWPQQQFYLFDWALGSSFKPSSFDFNHDLDRVDARLSSTLNANVADLSDFERRGGKLLLYTGIADPAVPVAEVVNYYERVAAAAGGVPEAARFARLFLVPGMGHCFGGPGVTNIGQLGEAMPVSPKNDILMQLVAWTEGGEMPEQIVARKPAGTTSPAQERPICSYPALPDYRGGDPAKATSFACTAHTRGADQMPASRYLN
jgi:feruloyl esterase